MARGRAPTAAPRAPPTLNPPSVWTVGTHPHPANPRVTACSTACCVSVTNSPVWLLCVLCVNLIRLSPCVRCFGHVWFFFVCLIMF